MGRGLSRIPQPAHHLLSSPDHPSDRRSSTSASGAEAHGSHGWTQMPSHRRGEAADWLIAGSTNGERPRSLGNALLTTTPLTGNLEGRPYNARSDIAMVVGAAILGARQSRPRITSPFRESADTPPSDSLAATSDESRSTTHPVTAPSTWKVAPTMPARTSRWLWGQPSWVPVRAGHASLRLSERVRTLHPRTRLRRRVTSHDQPPTLSRHLQPGRSPLQCPLGHRDGCGGSHPGCPSEPATHHFAFPRECGHSTLGLACGDE